MVESTEDYKALPESAPKLARMSIADIKSSASLCRSIESYDFKSYSKSLKQEIDELLDYLYHFKPLSISTPFKGTCFQISNIDSRIYFGSREGKIGVADLDRKQIIADIDLNEKSLWWIALSNDDLFLYSAGRSTIISKFQASDMKLVNQYKYHTDEINVICLTNDGKFMYSVGDDGMLVEWDLVKDDGSFRVLIEVPDLTFSGMHLSENQEWLALVGGSRILIYDRLNDKFIRDLTNEDFDYLWSVCIVPSNEFVVFGNNEGYLFVYDLRTWEQVANLNFHSATIRAIRCTSDSRFIITASYDNMIHVFNLKDINEGLQLIGHTDWIKSLAVLEDDCTLVSMSDDKTIRAWSLPRFDFYTSKPYITPANSNQQILSCSSDPSILIFLDHNSISSLNLESSLRRSFSNLSNQKFISAYNKAEDILVIIFVEYFKLSADTAQKDFKINEFKGSNLDKIKESTGSFHGVFCMKFSQDFKILAVGEHHRVTLLNFPDYTVKHSFLSHKERVRDISFSFDSKFMFSYDDGGQFKSYDLENLIELKTLIDQKDEKLKLADCLNEEYLVTYDPNQNLQLWSISKLSVIWSAKVEFLNEVSFDREYNSMLVLNNGKITVFTVPSMEVEYEIETEESIDSFCLSYDNTKIHTISSNKIITYENPNRCNKLAAFGDIRKIHSFFQYLGSLLSSKSSAYDPSFNSWILEPFHINMLHIYMYLGLESHIVQAINDGIGFLVSRSGYSPLDICLELNYNPGIELLYRKIKKSSLSNPLFLSLMENSISGLCSDQSETNFKIINLLLTTSIDKNLHKFTHTDQSTPIVIETSSVFSGNSDFSQLVPYANEGQPIEFKQTYFKVCLVPGATKSIELTEAILDTDNDKIFLTSFVQVLLNEKWKEVRIVLWIQAFVYVVYLFCLSYYSVTGTDLFLIFAFGINILLLFYELRQLASGWSYFKDVWNFIDLITTVMMAVMFFISFQSAGPDSLTSVVLLFSWVRGISYFRIIKKTRYYINLLRNVLVDIMPFMFILLYSTLAFSVIFEVLDIENSSFTSSFSVIWEMNIGGFNTEKYSGLVYFYFFLHSVLNPILMLNLLISIMSFTFDQVNSNVQVADGKELASMILEGENVFFWNRNSTQMSYIHVCQAIEPLKTSDDLNFLIKTVKKKISIVARKQDEVSNNVENLGEIAKRLEAKHDSMAQTLELISKKING